MPQPNKIPLAFAASGDKNIIPESTETTGLASWREGFPAITSTPFSEGGIAPKRADFNGIFNVLSQAVMWIQQGGMYVYDADTDYEAGNVVLDGGGMYVANAANGPSSAVVQPSSDMTGATWKLVRLDLATQSAAGYMSAADKIKLDSAPTLTNSGTISGYALFNNILLEWGFCTARSSGQGVSFSRPYKEIPRIFLTPQLNNTGSISAAQTAFCIDRSLTGFTAVSYPASSIDCGFFAIGIGE